MSLISVYLLAKTHVFKNGHFRLATISSKIWARAQVERSQVKNICKLRIKNPTQ
jgi:hypothetical protein